MYFWCLFFLPELLMYLTQKQDLLPSQETLWIMVGQHPLAFSRPHLLLATTKKAGNMQTSLRISGTLQRTLTNSKLWAPPLKNYFSVLSFYLSMPDGLFIICNLKIGSLLCP